MTVTKGILIGDSIVSNMYVDGGGTPLLAGGNTVTKLAVAGHTIQDQYAVWLASAARGDASYNWIYYQCGINNILHNDQSEATIRSAYQTFIADIKAQNPGAVLWVSKMMPAKGYLDAINGTRYPLWQAVNADYLADYPSNYRTEVSDQLNDGADSLQAIYQSGDGGLHPNHNANVATGTTIRGWIDAVFEPPPSPPPPFSPTYWQRFRVRGA